MKKPTAYTLEDVCRHNSELKELLVLALPYVECAVSDEDYSASGKKAIVKLVASIRKAV